MQTCRCSRSRLSAASRLNRGLNGKNHVFDLFINLGTGGLSRGPPESLDVDGRFDAARFQSRQTFLYFDGIISTMGWQRAGKEKKS